MRGLGGFIFGFGAIAVSFLILVMVGIYCVIASEPNLRLLYAAIGAFVTMLVFLTIAYLQDYGILDFRSEVFDVLGPFFIILSIVVAIVVYAKT